MINKTKLIKIICKELNNSITYFHILSVINIFIEELITEIEKKKIIKVPNFGKFKLKQMKSKKIINVLTNKPQQTAPSSVLRFTLTKKLRTYLKRIV